MATPPDPGTLPNISQCLLEKPLDAFLCIQEEAASSSALRNYSYCASGSLPVPLSNDPVCSPGFYCPLINSNDTSTWPQYCPPTTDCALLRYSNQWCVPQGKYEPALCLPGYYCPTMKEQLPCPEGSFCVRGTSVPQLCSMFSLCPEGTHIGIFYGGTVFSLIIDFVLILLFLWYYYYAEPLWTKQTTMKRRLYMVFQGKQLVRSNLVSQTMTNNAVDNEITSSSSSSSSSVSIVSYDNTTTEIVSTPKNNHALSRTEFLPTSVPSNLSSAVGTGTVTLSNPFHAVNENLQTNLPNTTDNLPSSLLSDVSIDHSLPISSSVIHSNASNSSSSSSSYSSSSSSSSLSNMHPISALALPLPPSVSTVTVVDNPTIGNSNAFSSSSSPVQRPSSSARTSIVPLISNSLWTMVEQVRSVGRQIASSLRVNSSLPPGVIIEDIGNGKKRVRTKSMRRASNISGPLIDTTSSDSPTESVLFTYGNESNDSSTASKPTESVVSNETDQRNDRIARMTKGVRNVLSPLSLATASSFSSPSSPRLSKASQLIRRPSIYIRDSLVRSIQSSTPESKGSLLTPSSPSTDPKQLLSAWFQSRQSSLSSFQDGSRNGDRQTTSAASAVLGHVFQACNTGLRLHLQFENLGLTLPPPISKTILASVTGEICPGRVTAVMGPSGAGKTTFLSVLMGRTKRTQGILRINNSIEEMERYRQVTGFVPQDDVMLSELTVRENIEYSARIRLPRNTEWTKHLSGETNRIITTTDIDNVDTEIENVNHQGTEKGSSAVSLTLSSSLSRASTLWSRLRTTLRKAVRDSSAYEVAIRAHVDAVIEVLGLTSCADTLAGNISGGQRKRTNIGIELAAAPTALFLDEPTSGLDATAALEVCATLRVIANLGLTVVAVIHQPRAEIFASFDDLLLLAPGGRTVYMGPQSNAVQYFLDCGMVWGDSSPASSSSSIIYRNGNPADIVLDFIAGRDQLRIPSEDIERLKLSSFPSFDGDTSAGLIEGSSVAVWLSSRWKIYQAKIKPNDPSIIVPNNTVSTDPPVRALTPIQTVRSSLRQFSVVTQTKIDQTRKTMNSAKGWFYRTCLRKGANLSPHKDPLTILLQYRGATFTKQYILALERSFIQQYRRPSWLVLEIAVVVAAGAVMGLAATAVEELFSSILKPPYTILSPAPLTTMLPSLGLYINMAIGIAGSPAAVRIFGEEGDVAIREARTGHNSLAYYLAKQTASLPRLILAALHFASVFCLLALPTSNFVYLFVMSLGIFFGTYGLGICVSLMVSRANASLVGVIASLIMACLCGFGPNIHQFNDWNIGFLHTLAVSRWANELWIHAETLLYRDKYLVEEITTAAFGYTLDRPTIDIVMMITLGIGLRIVAYGLLFLKLRK